MKTVLGNLVELGLNGHFDVIVHGCNCFNTMGAGIAKEIKKKIPEAYNEDATTIKGDKQKLDNYTEVTVKNRIGGDSTVINAYTQYNYGNSYGKDLVNYESLKNIFRTLNLTYANLDITIAYPAIGAGLAGGDWNKIQQIINEELCDVNHVFVKFNK